MKMKFKYLLFALALVGCTGMERGCSVLVAENLGADWIILKTDMAGKPFRCWQLEDASVTNESASDGIYWKAPNGHLVHVSGFYDRVQVTGGDWNGAFKELGLTAEQCKALRNDNL